MYNEILKQMQVDEEAFNSLPTSEKLRVSREKRVASLLEVGYITPDEAKTYREQLTELPQDRKGLVVAYYLRGLYNSLYETPTMETTEKIADTIASFHLSERGALKNGKTIADTLTPEEQIRWTDELTAIHISEEIKIAETFVDAKRKRIRAKLLNFLSLEIAVSLSMPDDGELDSIPYLRELLQEKGYRANAKSLNDGDKKAIQEAALHYLNLLELSFLNGVGLLRYEEYKSLRDEEDETFKEDFYYRDVYDEALTEFECTYLAFDRAISVTYSDNTPKVCLDFLDTIYRKAYLQEEEGIFKVKLNGGKFSYLLEEAKLC